MITPEAFPYISGIHVNDCYAYQDFDIELHNYKPFSHLILTGKNGSGKTTVLNAINDHLLVLLGLDPDLKGNPSLVQSMLFSQMRGNYMEGLNSGWENLKKIEDTAKNYNKLRKIHIYDESPSSTTYGNRFSALVSDQVIFSYLKAKRETRVALVETPTKESNFVDALSKPNSGEYLNENFQQYLINKKVDQAFDRLDNNEDRIQSTEQFFEKLTQTFRSIFEDNKLIIEFVRERYETPLKLFNGRVVTFNALPEGYSGILRIVLDLFIRVDLLRKKVGNNAFDPCGIVLIDEPEVHLHLELQEQILPLLTSLFPNIQFIAATHSPAVIASIKNATIFDLTTKETRTSEATVGRSYAELTTSHFGLENDYSSIADCIIRQINEAVDVHRHNPEALKESLEKIAIEQSAYLSPTLRVEMELLLAKAEAQQAVAR